MTNKRFDVARVFSAGLLFRDVIVLECGKRRLDVSKVNKGTVQCSYIHSCMFIRQINASIMHSRIPFPRT